LKKKLTFHFIHPILNSKTKTTPHDYAHPSLLILIGNHSKSLIILSHPNIPNAILEN
jgi:hypothetical protein